MSRFDYLQFRDYRPTSTRRNHVVYMVSKVVLQSYYLRGSRDVVNGLCFTDIVERVTSLGIVRFTPENRNSYSLSVHVSQVAIAMQICETDIVRRELGRVGFKSGASAEWMDALLDVVSLYDALAAIFKQSIPWPWHVPCIIYTDDYHLFSPSSIIARQGPDTFDLLMSVQNIIKTVKRYGPPALYDAFSLQLPKSYPRMAFAIRHHIRLFQYNFNSINYRIVIFIIYVFIEPRVSVQTNVESRRGSSEVLLPSLTSHSCTSAALERLLLGRCAHNRPAELCDLKRSGWFNFLVTNSYLL